jgi:thiamine-phosphate pyrophosphorylase
MHPAFEPRRGLYAITPDEPDTPRLVRAVDAALAGGAAVVQYRNKTAGAALRRSQAEALALLCAAHGTPLIVNDDVALALEVDGAGAHLGKADGDLADARRRLGSGRLLGASCYNRFELAAGAVAAGANYVAFGSFYASSTKPAAVRAAPELIGRAKRELAVPVAAIGGITLGNAGRLVEAGADWLCVLSALFDAADPRKVRENARGFSALYAAAGEPGGPARAPRIR